MEEAGLSKGFDYRVFKKNEEEEEHFWQEKIIYGLNNPDLFLAYIDKEWR